MLFKSKALTILATLAFVVSPVFAQDKPMFHFTYVKFTYSCRQNRIVVYSQVFGMCYQDMVPHSVYARNTQEPEARSAAGAHCVGTLSTPMVNQGTAYQGRNAGATPAEGERVADMNVTINGLIYVNNFVVSAPYTQKCQ